MRDPMRTANVAYEDSALAVSIRISAFAKATADRSDFGLGHWQLAGSDFGFRPSDFISCLGN
jgi:hypothetical protein